MCNTPLSLATLRAAVIEAVTREYVHLFGVPRSDLDRETRALFLSNTVDAALNYHIDPRNPANVSAYAREIAKNGVPVFEFARHAIQREAPRHGVTLAALTPTDAANLAHAGRVLLGANPNRAEDARTGQRAAALLQAAERDGGNVANIEAEMTARVRLREEMVGVALADAHAQARERATMFRDPPPNRPRRA